MQGKEQRGRYYVFIVLSFIAAIGVVVANNLILLLVCWGFLGLTLYLLIAMGDETSRFAAKKSLVMVGGTDALMILGIGIIYYFAHSMRIDAIKLEFSNRALVCAYLCVAAACFAKAGAMPFHSWIPECAKSAPISVTAFLPASLDKLLGIYLLTRLSLGIFVMNDAMNIFLMVIGGFTIIGAVMMALVQHDMKRLLGYHAVSQVGYMVVGLGTGNAIGIAGGLFHMLNHAVYKSCLFLSAGNVEYRTKTSALDRLGGLSKVMPITYISSLIASFSIAGIPPFNGFVSKWLIYQGLILRFSQRGPLLQLLLVAFCLVAALFGSGLTLASFIKFLHSVFLGQRLETQKRSELREVHWMMWLPGIVLAGICLVFGVFAFVLPLKYFILPAVAMYIPFTEGSMIHLWSWLAVSLILCSLAAGALVFRGKSARLKFNVRQDAAFSGGELVETAEANMVTGTDFYTTLKEMRLLQRIYLWAEEGVFDIYEQGKRALTASIKPLQHLHNGVLPTYLVWALLGVVGLLVFLIR